ncbi:PREDICTED: uncharacterized protein LOC109158067 [Ipomoea nil]|uniref:uncharacterized protein LOC109158067 n=1 Tax=Ipomoea nil TaxID=35883 RepID=UPI000901ACFF|nr:PREDICTED: uncharacterized protein LOC109158067 [Ipomoea nil]XP_019161440.1 PREDICTED: uncharacterized protein LOC109158067 [Ipomoea nil]
MVSTSTWIRYLANKAEYAYHLCWKNYTAGNITEREAGDAIFKHFFQGKLTFVHFNKGGEEMAPTVGAQGGTLLVRKIPMPNPMKVFVGDVVVLRDPVKHDNFLVRRLAAIEGYEMASTDEKDEPFVLEEDQCWVVADNENIKPKDANDSRTFGPVCMADIIGRVIYCLKSAVDHGPVNNSNFSIQKDTPVLEVELDVDEMAKNHKA